MSDEYVYPHESNGVAHHGLTKRELCAVAAMKGLVAADTDMAIPEATIAHLAVKQADALLYQLEESKE